MMLNKEPQGEKSLKGGRACPVSPSRVTRKEEIFKLPCLEPSFTWFIQKILLVSGILHFLD